MNEASVSRESKKRATCWPILTSEMPNLITWDLLTRERRSMFRL